MARTRTLGLTATTTAMNLAPISRDGNDTTGFGDHGHEIVDHREYAYDD